MNYTTTRDKAILDRTRIGLSKVPNAIPATRQEVEEMISEGGGGTGGGGSVSQSFAGAAVLKFPGQGLSENNFSDYYKSLLQKNSNSPVIYCKLAQLKEWRTNSRLTPGKSYVVTNLVSTVGTKSKQYAAQFLAISNKEVSGEITLLTDKTKVVAMQGLEFHTFGPAWELQIPLVTSGADAAIISSITGLASPISGVVAAIVNNNDGTGILKLTAENISVDTEQTYPIQLASSDGEVEILNTANLIQAPINKLNVSSPSNTEIDPEGSTSLIIDCTETNSAEVEVDLSGTNAANFFAYFDEVGKQIRLVINATGKNRSESAYQATVTITGKNGTVITGSSTFSITQAVAS